MRPVTLDINNVRAALLELERASHEADTTEIAQNFTVDDPAFTPEYEVNTTTPTAANVAAVLATLITVLTKGGLNRTT